MKTIGLISGNNIHADKDGNFEITVNSSGPRDIKNHIQTSPGSKGVLHKRYDYRLGE